MKLSELKEAIERAVEQNPDVLDNEILLFVPTKTVKKDYNRIKSYKGVRTRFYNYVYNEKYESNPHFVLESRQ